MKRNSFRFGGILVTVEVDVRRWGIGVAVESHRSSGIYIGIVIGPFGLEIERVQ